MSCCTCCYSHAVSATLRRSLVTRLPAHVPGIKYVSQQEQHVVEGGCHSAPRKSGLLLKVFLCLPGWLFHQFCPLPACAALQLLSPAA